jgi:hypothetical protein
VVQVALRAMVAFWMEMPRDLVVVWRILYTSNMSADNLLYHFGMEANQP